MENNTLLVPTRERNKECEPKREGRGRREKEKDKQREKERASKRVRPYWQDDFSDTHTSPV